MSLKSSAKVETNVYELEVSIEGAAFADAVNKTYLKQKGRISIPGFRKGKAPRAFIEKMYGADVFYEDALQLVYPDAVESAVKEAGLQLVDAPYDVQVESMTLEGVELKLKATVKPEVTLGEYKGLKAAKESVAVSDEEIAEELGRMQDRNARMVTVEDRAAQDGDMAVIDFEGFVDGVAFEGGKAENHELTLGSNQFIPGFEEQIVGHTAGDAFDINVKFPEEYAAEELKDKEATFKIKLHEIKAKDMPALDDEFAKDVSEFDTLDELKANISEGIEHRKQHESDDAVEHQLIEQLIDGMQAEIPEVMFAKRVDESVRDFEYRMQSQGLTIDAYLQYTGMDMEKFRESFRAQAERQVKTRLAFEKIVALEGLEASEEEMNAEYQKYADQYKMDVEAVKKAIPDTDLREDLAVNKAIELVKESAVITEGEAEEKPVKKAAVKKAAAKKPAAKKPAAKKTKKADEEADAE